MAAKGADDGGGKRGRGKAITFPELMCSMWSALGTNERFSAGATTAVRLSSFNTTYTPWVKWMKEHDKWRDQHGKPVTDITPEESIDLRVQEVNTKTKKTPISYQQDRVITVCRNEHVPLFDKIVDKDGKIPSGKQVSDIQEELRVAYFNSLTGDNPPDPVSSEDEVTGDCVSPCFLETDASIQKAVKTGDCSNHEELHTFARNEQELLEKAQAKKGKKLLSNTVDEMEESGRTTWWTWGAVELCGKTERWQSQVVIGAGHTRASLGANSAGTRPGFPTQHTQTHVC